MKARISATSLLVVLLLAVVCRSEAASTTAVSVVIDGGFELGHYSGQAWQQASTNGAPLIVRGNGRGGAHAGEFRARLGKAKNEVDSISQEMAIPDSAASAELTYWYRINAKEAEKDSTGPDTFTVSVDLMDGSQARTLVSLVAPAPVNDWTFSGSIPLTFTIGRVFRLKFELATADTDKTEIFLDDVNVRYLPREQSPSTPLLFLNPRTGCLGGGFPQIPVAVSGSVALTAGANTMHTPKMMRLDVDGKELGRSVSVRVRARVDSTTLPADGGVVTATLDDATGAITKCPIRIIPVPILQDGGFEAGPQTLNWALSTPVSAHPLIASGVNPGPLDGDYMLRLGGVATKRDLAEQVFALPTDMTGGSLSFFYRVISQKKGGAVSDHLMVTLTDVDGGYSSPLLQLSNLTATAADGSYMLFDAPIPTSLFGKKVRLSLSANAQSPNPTVFLFDDFGMWVTAASLVGAAKPKVSTMLDMDHPNLCSGTAVKVVTDVPVDRLTLIRRGQSQPISTCQNCTTLLANVNAPQDFCGSYFGEAEIGNFVVRSNIEWLATESGACSLDRLPPTVRITGVSSGQVVSGTILVGGEGGDDHCVRSVSLLIDGKIVKTTFGDSLAHLLDTRRLSRGSHRIELVAVDGGGNRSNIGALSSATVDVENTLTCAYGALPCGQAAGNDTGPFVPADQVCSGAGTHCPLDPGPCESIENCALLAMGRLQDTESNIGKCGGILIAKNKFLTAAHCIADAIIASGGVENRKVNFPVRSQADGPQDFDVVAAVCGNANHCVTSDQVQGDPTLASTAVDWAVLTLRANVEDRNPIPGLRTYDPRLSLMLSFPNGAIGDGNVMASYLSTDPDNNYNEGLVGSKVTYYSTFFPSIDANVAIGDIEDPAVSGSPLLVYDRGNKIVAVRGVLSFYGRGGRCSQFAIDDFCSAAGGCTAWTCGQNCPENFMVSLEGLSHYDSLFDETHPISVLGEKGQSAWYYVDSSTGSGRLLAKCPSTNGDPGCMDGMKGYNWDTRHASSEAEHRIVVEQSKDGCSSVEKTSASFIVCNIVPFLWGEGGYDWLYKPNEGFLATASLANVDDFPSELIKFDTITFTWTKDGETSAFCSQTCQLDYACNMPCAEPQAGVLYNVEVSGWSFKQCTVVGTLGVVFRTCDRPDCNAYEPPPQGLTMVGNGDPTQWTMFVQAEAGALSDPTIEFQHSDPINSGLSSPRVCASNSCDFVWDTSGYPNGKYGYLVLVKSNGVIQDQRVGMLEVRR